MGLYLRRLLPHLHVLNKAGKTCPGKTHKSIQFTYKFGEKKFIRLMPLLREL
jgi:hypothetical protein